MIYSPFIQGFFLSAGLIIAIGSQNAFVLRQGLKKEYIFTICTICFVCDALLIFLGVGGVGKLIASSHTLMQIARWGGALFLIFYGIRSFYAAFKNETLSVDKSKSLTSGFTWAIVTTFALTLLNPHVYLDTVILLGSIAGQYPETERLSFAIGAAFASMIWFYAIGYGARILTPFFQKPSSWKILDVVIGAIMCLIAGNLLWPILFPL
ncbi:MAG: LysE/ArgO family amino acid transporter [Desulfuromusa sp.]|jgi:L-lysine exporter family protein LysE/ArgO|nr:LysE/ArgO family amino acid transporter [Desulfuromusa sp.]